MEVLTVVISDDIGNVNFAICVFRPQASFQDRWVSFPLSGQRRHSNVTIYLDTILVMVCREYERKKHWWKRSEITVYDAPPDCSLSVCFQKFYKSTNKSLKMYFLSSKRAWESSCLSCFFCIKLFSDSCLYI